MTLQVAEAPCEYARNLRRDQTDAERVLWLSLRDRRLAGAKFRRQHRIGPFIVDFVSRECRLVIELDGGHHAGRREEDEARAFFLERSGYRVLRFWNTDVLANLAGVLERIVATLRETAPSPPPSPRRGEGEGRRRG